MDVLPLLDELQTIARNGLAFATDPFDRERYERLLDLTCACYGRALDLPAAEVRRRLSGELGYITPKVGAEAAVFDEQGRILLVLRSDDERWCLPCGWVEPNESPAEAAVRETKEECGIDVRVLQLVDVFTRKPSAENGPHTAVAIAYLCEAVGGALSTSPETKEVRYWRIEEVPVWHHDHHSYATAAAAAWRLRGQAHYGNEGAAGPPSRSDGGELKGGLAPRPDGGIDGRAQDDRLITTNQEE